MVVGLKVQEVLRTIMVGVAVEDLQPRGAMVGHHHQTLTVQEAVAEVEFVVELAEMALRMEVGGED